MDAGTHYCHWPVETDGYRNLTPCSDIFVFLPPEPVITSDEIIVEYTETEVERD